MSDPVRQVGQCWKSGVSQLLELKLAVSVKGVYLGLVLSLHVRTVRQVAWNIQPVNKLPSAASNNTTFGPRLFLPNLHIIPHPHTFPRSSRSASKVKIYQPKHDGEWKVFPVTKELVFDWLWKMTKMTYCEIKACALFITECMCDKMTGVMLKWLFCCDDVRVCRTEVIPAAGEAAAHRMTILASLH